MKSKAGMKFECIFEEPLDFIDIDYTHINKTIRYEQRPHGEWISCSERLPDEMGDYLVTDNIKMVYSASFGYVLGESEMCFYYEDEDGRSIINEHIVAWMPLPEPYKKGGDDK